MEFSKEMLQKLSHIHWTTNLVNFPFMNSLVYDFWWQNSEDWRGKNMGDFKSVSQCDFQQAWTSFSWCMKNLYIYMRKENQDSQKTFDDWKIEYIDFYFYYLPSSTNFKIKFQYITSISKIIFSQVKAYCGTMAKDVQ